MTQLTLDVFASERVQPGSRAAREHQRGYVRLPFDTAGLGKAGEVRHAWVCCRCGGVELTECLLDTNHGCCTSVNPPCTLLTPGWRPFDAHWMPDAPRLAGAR